MTVDIDNNAPPISTGPDKCDAEHMNLRPQTGRGKGEMMHMNQSDSYAMEHLTDSTQTQQINLQQQQMTATPLASAAQTPREYYTVSYSRDTDEEPDHIPLAYKQTKHSQNSTEDRKKRLHRSEDKTVNSYDTQRNIMRHVQIHRLTHLQLAPNSKKLRSDRLSSASRENTE
jgi:hypothetical protein